MQIHIIACRVLTRELSRLIYDCQNAAYNRVGYIRTDTFDDCSQRKLAEDVAGRFNLQYKEFTGENRMLKKMVAGEFDEKDFLIVPPGYRTEYSNGPERIRAVACE